MAVLCRAFPGICLDGAYMKLACIDNGVQQLQQLSFADAIEMIVTFHKAKLSLEEEQQFLFFLLLDEFQLLRPLLQDRGLTTQAAQNFVTDACEMMYRYRVFVAKSQNCALFPLCAGTLIRDMTPSFDVSRWGKKPIALPLLPVEMGVKMLASSLRENCDNVLHSEGMKTLLNDVMIIPRFLQFIHFALAKPHIREQSRAGEVEHVVRAVRLFVEEEIYVRFGQHVGSEWKMIMYYCLIGMPVKLEQTEASEAAFHGYVFLKSFRGDTFRVRMPFA
ncbi:hypothetical protein GOP47_0019341 [Adiantum capillus-veneris]|uniref:Uncharacterized protein n=1 Tax=Adiantum capillus-veneris TaxID=13818 RepID=A0A9D4UFH2_ADICA|nr:hypothetical protein GOP47_0019341 [Adiantum capillus-veneris]